MQPAHLPSAPQVTGARSVKGDLDENRFSSGTTNAFDAYFRDQTERATRPTVEQRNFTLLASRMLMQYPSRRQEILNLLEGDSSVPQAMKTALQILLDCSTIERSDKRERCYHDDIQQFGKRFVTRLVEATSGKGYSFTDGSGRLVDTKKLEESAFYLLLARDAAFWWTRMATLHISFPIAEIETVRAQHMHPETEPTATPAWIPGDVPVTDESTDEPVLSAVVSPTYKELLLIWWEEEFSSYDPGCHDLDLQARFFEKRKKSETVGKIVAQQVEHATRWEHIFERFIKSQAAERYLTEDQRKDLTLQCSLHQLMESDERRVETLCTGLAPSGFDLREYSLVKIFQKCFSNMLSPSDQAKLEDRGWLEQIMTGNSSAIADSTAVVTDKSAQIDENAVRAAIRELHEMFREAPNRFELDAIATLYEGLLDIRITPSSIHQSSLFHRLSSLSPSEFFSRSRLGYSIEELHAALDYAEAALRDSTTVAELGEGYTRHLALLVYGAWAVKGCHDAAESILKIEHLKGIIPEERIRAATRLAWYFTDAEQPEAYSERTKSDRLEFVARYRAHLDGIKSIARFAKILDAEPGDLPKGAVKILTELNDLGLMEKLCVRHRLEGALTKTLRKLFEQTLESDTEYGLFRGLIDQRSSDLLKNPIFSKWVSENEKRAIQEEGIKRCIAQCEQEQDGIAARLIRFALRPAHKPYLPSTFNPKDLIVQLVLECQPTERWQPIMVQEFALPDDDSLESHAQWLRENYFDIQLLMGELSHDDRTSIRAMPEYRNFITWYLVSELDCAAGHGTAVGYLSLNKSRLVDNPNLVVPPHLQLSPEEALSSNHQWEFLAGIYRVERELGVVNEEAFRIGFLNIITRATYSHPRKFFPHTDNMLGLLHSPFARLLPRSGPGSVMLRPYRVLNEFLNT